MAAQPADWVLLTRPWLLVARIVIVPRAACLLSAAACALLGFTWQAVKVHYVYAGNWTSLFCTGANFTQPPSLASEHIYTFPDSAGYDGQFYHYIAHDPLLRTDISKYIDAPRLRYHRILLPALAYLLAAGQQAWIDPAYIAVHLAFVFLGAWWIARYLEMEGRSPYWAMLFVVVPGVAISLDRLTIDTSLTALAAGFALYVRLGSKWRLYLLLAAAALSRDTGVLFAAACCLAYWKDRRFAQGMLFASAAIPAAAWHFYVQSQTQPFFYAGASEVIPLSGIVSMIVSPVPYRFTPAQNALVITLDYLMLFGMLWLFWLCLRLLRRRPLGAIEIALLLWTILGVFLPRTIWDDCCSSGRVFSPMLVLHIMRNAAELGFASVPLLLVAPRTWVQLAAEGLRIVKAIANPLL